ncbi:hypothetical protein [Halovivax sp.]|uniref:hypothetical protein n=1 Tax=Halovivax sp. TaxID=1935978 RepID=UPI0025C2F221|nr:hypothetical protein [Halovivax sp.]
MPRNAVRLTILLALVSFVGLALLSGLGAADASAQSDRESDRGTACETPDDAAETIPKWAPAHTASGYGVTTAFSSVGCGVP